MIILEPTLLSFTIALVVAILYDFKSSFTNFQYTKYALKIIVIFTTLKYILLGLTGCETINHIYHQYDLGIIPGEFTEMQVTESVFSVSFENSEDMEAKEAMDYLLYKASEVTLQNKFRYFSIIETNESYKRFTSKDDESNIISTISSRLFIIIKCQNKRPKDKLLYDAILVIANVRNKYGLTTY